MDEQDAKPEASYSSPEAKGSYEIYIRILNTELLRVGLSSSSISNRWMALGSVVLFCALVLLGAYGESLYNLYKYMAK